MLRSIKMSLICGFFFFLNYSPLFSWWFSTFRQGVFSVVLKKINKINHRSHVQLWLYSFFRTNSPIVRALTGRSCCVLLAIKTRLLLSGTLDYKNSFGKSNTDPNTNYTFDYIQCETLTTATPKKCSMNRLKTENISKLNTNEGAS